MTVAALPSEPRPSAGLGAAGWRAELALCIERRETRSVIAGRRHLGPLTVQRAFYPESNGCCHVYLVHPPGGIVGGDRLSLSVELAEGAHALLTTPAATKFYRSAGQQSEVVQEFRVGSGACLEWMPQETIAFSAALARTTTRVELARDACFFGWEIVCLGRRAAGEEFSRGHFEQRLRIEREGDLLLKERLSLAGGGVELGAPWGMAGRACQGTLVVVGPNLELADLLKKVRSEVSCANALFAATAVGDVLLCRFLGEQGFEARRVLHRAWQVLRPEVLGWPAVAPRIWAT